MGKLFKLKSWLTLPEAANHLTNLFGESVTETDILKLGLDRKLKLSVVFVGGVWASFCKPVADDEIKYEEVGMLDGTGTLRLPIGGQITYAGAYSMVGPDKFNQRLIRLIVTSHTI
jgi:hypothetical protein